MKCVCTKDKLYYYLVLLIGTGILFPYNAFITAYDYFSYRFPGQRIEFLIMATYTFPNLLTLAFISKFGHKFSILRRVIIWFAVALALLVIVPLVSDFGLSKTSAFIITLAGVCTGVLQGTIFGFCAQISALFVQSVFSGEAMAGTVVAVIRLGTKQALPDDEEGLYYSSVIYFALAALVVVLSIFSFVYLYRTPSMRNQIKHLEPHEGKEESAMIEVEERNGDGGSSSLQIIEEEELKPYTLDYDKDEVIESTDIELETQKDEIDPAELEAGGTSDHLGEIRVIHILYHIRSNAFFVFFNFCVTLTIFPGMLTRIPSSWIDPSWFSLVLFFFFDFTDLISRFLPRAIILKERIIFAIIIIRVCLIALVFLCIHRLIFNDFVTIVIVIALGMTNGYCGTTMMMYGSQKVDTRFRGIAGTILTFCLLFGITLGSILGLALDVAVLKNDG